MENIVLLPFIEFEVMSFLYWPQWCFDGTNLYTECRCVAQPTSLLMIANKKYQNLGCIICCITIFFSILLLGYHAGIKYNFWTGPLSCSSSGIPNTLSPELFLEAILTTSVPRCDEVVWTFLNTSMAGWNLLLSILLLILWTLVTFKVLRDPRC